MGDFNWKEFYKEQVEWYKKQIEWDNKQIAWITKEIEDGRKRDREMVEWVWSKGVLTEWQMRAYGNPKKYESADTHERILARRRAYRSRKHNMAKLTEYRVKLL